jgi:hypothetical protein
MGFSSGPARRDRRFLSASVNEGRATAHGRSLAGAPADIRGAYVDLDLHDGSLAARSAEARVRVARPER